MPREPHNDRSVAEATMVEPKPVTWQSRLLERYYTGRPGWENGTAYLHRYILEHAPGRGPVLELGPGPSNRTTRFLRDHFDRVDGLDIDPDVRQNEDLTTAVVYDGGLWPVPACAYEVIVADFVFEHVADPDLTLREAARCLMPGGVLVLRTPNLFHYVTMGSRLTPHWFHVKVVSRLKRQAADEHDPYPTFYRLNTPGVVHRRARGASLEVVDVTRIEREPAYGMASRLLFYPFMWYERLVNSTERLAFARSVMVATLRRPAAALG